MEFYLILISIVMAFVVGGIAWRKGFLVPLWFVYGLFIWPAALIHALLAPPTPPPPAPAENMFARLWRFVAFAPLWGAFIVAVVLIAIIYTYQPERQPTPPIWSESVPRHR